MASSYARQAKDLAAGLVELQSVMDAPQLTIAAALQHADNAEAAALEATACRERASAIRAQDLAGDAAAPGLRDVAQKNAQIAARQYEAVVSLGCKPQLASRGLTEVDTPPDGECANTVVSERRAAAVQFARLPTLVSQMLRASLALNRSPLSPCWQWLT
jgi:hypothetical protein